MAAGELASEGPSTGPVPALACPLVPTATGGGKEEDGVSVGQTWARSAGRGPGRAGSSSGCQGLRKGQGWGLRVRVSGLSKEFILRFTLTLNN